MIDYHARHGVKQFHVDGAGELVSFASNFDIPGVEIFSRKPYCLQENPRAERIIQKLITGARTLLLSANAPSYLWAEAVSHFVWLSNHRYSFASKDIPANLFETDPQHPNWDEVIPFGTKVEFFIEKKPAKLESRLSTGYFMGYSDNRAVPKMIHYKGARIYLLDSKKVVVGRIMKTHWHEYLPADSRNIFEFDSHYSDNQDSDYSDNNDLDHSDDAASSTNETAQPDEEVPQSRTQRPAFGRIPGFYEGLAVHQSKLTRKDILNSDKRELWLLAEQQELQQLERKQVYEIVPTAAVPNDQKILPVKFVYAEKPHKLKARLTVCGNFAPVGVTDPYAPTVSTAGVFMVLAICSLFNWKLDFFDVEAAYLEATLPITAYCHLPPAFQLPNQYARTGQKVCWKLKKALYGLRESAQAWYNRARTLLTQAGYTSIPVDQCLYILRSELGVSILAVHVDDITSTSSTSEIRDWVKTTLHKLFPLKETNSDSTILSIQIEQHKEGFYLSMPRAINHFFDTYDLREINTKTAPIPLGFTIEYDSPVEDLARNIRGSLSYIARMVRSDISRHPRLTPAKRIARFLKHTASDKLFFPSGSNSATPEIIGFCDSNFHRSGPQANENTYGYIFFLKDSSSPQKNLGARISACSKKLKTAADSTALAEIYGLHMAVKEALFLKTMFNHLGFQQSCVTIFCDSQAVVQYVNSGKITERNKHWDAKYLLITEHIRKRHIAVSHIAGDDNPADMLTKPLSETRLKYLKEMCNMTSDHPVPHSRGCVVYPGGANATP